MQELLPINLMVTSRPIPVIASDFCDSLSVHIRANETDICNYVPAPNGSFASGRPARSQLVTGDS